MKTISLKLLLIIIIGLLTCTVSLCQENNKQNWTISVLPSSVRLDPVTNKIIEERFSAVKNGPVGKENLLEKNWIYNGNKVSLKSARGEYISFQLV